jgi:hypothetical protein
MEIFFALLNYKKKSLKLDEKSVDLVKNQVITHKLRTAKIPKGI